MIKLTPKQKIANIELSKYEYTEVLFDGGSRAGKTFEIIYWYCVNCLLFPGIRFLVARLRFNHVKASIWLQTLPVILKAFKGHYVINGQDYIIRFNNGSEIWFGGLDDKERTEKILGQEYASIFLNEAVQIAQATVGKVESRLAQNIEGFTNVIIFDCNPRHPQHYLYKRFYINKKPKQLQIHWTPFDNLEHLPKDYIDRLENLPELDKKRFLDGAWVSLPGAVYQNIKESNIIDCKQDWGAYDYLTIGQDWGYYSATSIWGVKENKAYCLHEIVLIDKTTADIIAKLNEVDSTYAIKSNSVPIYCDHELDRIQELCNSGFNAMKANKEVGSGDSTVNSYELYFDKSCMNTYQSMLNLIRQQDNNGVFFDAHVKENDHEADSGRYALHSGKIKQSNSSSFISIGNVY
jgi:PBSX family phage terminase large subunit